MVREISAGAIVFRNGKEGREYLLLQYGWGHWDFPKGHIEPGESELDTVRREMAEETGISRIKVIDGFREVIKYFYQKRRKPGKAAGAAPEKFFKIVTFYLVETRMRTVHLSHEHIDYAWLPIEQAIRQTTFQNSKTLLRKAERYLKN